MKWAILVVVLMLSLNTAKEGRGNPTEIEVEFTTFNVNPEGAFGLSFTAFAKLLSPFEFHSPTEYQYSVPFTNPVTV